MNEELLSWQIGYFILVCGLIILLISHIHSYRFIRKLKNSGKYISQKGTFMFVPHKKGVVE